MRFRCALVPGKRSSALLHVVGGGICRTANSPEKCESVADSRHPSSLKAAPRPEESRGVSTFRVTPYRSLARSTTLDMMHGAPRILARTPSKSSVLTEKPHSSRESQTKATCTATREATYRGEVEKALCTKGESRYIYIAIMITRAPAPLAKSPGSAPVGYTISPSPAFCGSRRCRRPGDCMGG